MTDFDPDWPHGHVTRDGRKARLGKERINNPTFPLYAFIEKSNGEEMIETYTDTGRVYWNDEDEDDLFNAPVPKRVWEGWAVLMKSGHVQMFACEAKAKNFIDESDCLITPVRIEFPPEEPAR